VFGSSPHTARAGAPRADEASSGPSGIGALWHALFVPGPQDAPTELDSAHAPTEQVPREIDWRLAAAPAGAAFCAGLVVASAVIPWYAVQIGPLETPASLTGLESGSFALIAIALGAFVVVASAALALGAAGVVDIDAPIGLLLTWVCLGAAGAAAALVALRLVFLPEPSEFLTRDIGIWLAFLGSLGAAGLSALQLPARTSGTRAVRSVGPQGATRPNG
jgi:hypothetical protein